MNPSISQSKIALKFRISKILLKRQLNKQIQEVGF